MKLRHILLLSAYPPGVFQYGIEKALRQLGHRVFTAGPATAYLGALEEALQRHEPGYRYDAMVAADATLASLLTQCPFAPDVVLFLDAGTPCLPPDLVDAPCPVVGLLAEDLLHADLYAQILPYFDLALVTWKSTERSWRAHGHDNVRQWYFGARPDFCVDEGLPRIYDVAFLGNLSPRVQRRRLPMVQKLLRLRDEGLNVYVGNDLYFAEYNRIHCQSKIVYHQGITDQVNMRVFEAMGAGCLVVMRRPRDPDDPTTYFFRDGETAVFCDTDEQALERIRYYLAHDAERARIADAGRRTVLAKHNYADVVRTLFEDVLPELPADLTAARRARLRQWEKDDRRRRLDYAIFYGVSGMPQAAQNEVKQIPHVVDDAEAINLVGVLCDSIGQADRAGDYFRRASALDPTSLVAPFNLAVAGLVAHRPEAEAWCEEALARLAAVDPGAVAATAVEGPYASPTYGRFRMEVARAYLDHPSGPGRARALINLYRYRLHHLRAGLHGERGDFERAAADLEAALAIVPDDGYLLHSRACTRAALGLPVAAIFEDLERAMALEPFFAQAQYDYAVALEQAGRPAEALAQYRDLLHHNPLYEAPAELVQHVAELALTLGRMEQARDAVEAGDAPAADRASIIMALADDPRLVQRAVASLAEHTPAGSYELLILRRGASRAIDAFLSLVDAPLTVLSSGSAAEDYARAAAQATGDHLVLLDPHVVVDTDWLPPLLAAASERTLALPVVSDGDDAGTPAAGLACCVDRETWHGLGGLHTGTTLASALEDFERRLESQGGRRVTVSESRLRRFGQPAAAVAPAVATAGGAAIASGSHGMRHVPKPAAEYFHFARPEVAALVPLDARRVLDVGCGGGALGALLKRRPGVEVVGIETDPEAAAVARGRLDDVLVVDVEKLDCLPVLPRSFDCIVFADVLEHLVDPERVVARLLPYLSETGTVVASIPNVRHQDVLLDLLVNGRWRYQPAGILDATHLRFFTLYEIAAMFDRLGLVMEGLEASGSAADPRMDKLAELVTELGGDGVRFNSECRAVQYIFRARPQPRPASPQVVTRPGAGADRPRVSIIVLAWNELPYTKECVASIQASTRPPYELILVDNGSTDETLEFFRTVPGAKIVANGSNLGFAGGNNRGILAATGDYIIILNNDTLVTDGWLDRLVACAEGDPAIGIVGPMSNYVSGPQLVPDASYADYPALQAYAREFYERHRGRRSDTNRLVGFCMLIKREVIARIGLLDESFGLGNFEDDDYCLRARQAGFRLVIAGDVFIHHFGSRTFFGQRVDFEAAMRHGQEVFQRKWSAPQPAEAKG